MDFADTIATTFDCGRALPAGLVARCLHCSLGVRLQQIVSFVDLAVEVSGVGQQLSVIDDLLIQKHTRDTWSELLPKDLVNGSVNGVADEVVPVLLVGRREALFNLRSIQLRKCNTAL